MSKTLKKAKSLYNQEDSLDQFRNQNQRQIGLQGEYGSENDISAELGSKLVLQDKPQNLLSETILEESDAGESQFFAEKEENKNDFEI
tara:strand:- start:359 stop:622 length:264 start_codon:yes stop_codon:yes gene_type:complete